MELAVFRMVQESLTNIHRHSESKTASVRLTREGTNVCLEVRDQGRGIPPNRLREIHSQGSGVGIRGMRERLRPFGGHMEIQSNGSGTSILAIIPIPAESQSAGLEPLQAAV